MSRRTHAGSGYSELTLWTNDILHAARKIYVAEGFRLVAEDRHHSFGHDLVGQNWTLNLGAPIGALPESVPCP